MHKYIVFFINGTVDSNGSYTIDADGLEYNQDSKFFMFWNGGNVTDIFNSQVVASIIQVKDKKVPIN